MKTIRNTSALALPKGFEKARPLPGSCYSSCNWPVAAVVLLRVTPAIARFILDAYNSMNRECGDARKHAFQGLMANGEFGISIVSMALVGKKRVLTVDGQGRLLAIANLRDENYATDMVFVFYRCRNMADYKELFAIFDRVGKKRDRNDYADLEARSLGLDKSPRTWARIVAAMCEWLVTVTSQEPKASVKMAHERPFVLRKYPKLRNWFYNTFFLNHPDMACSKEEPYDQRLRRALVMLAARYAREDDWKLAEEFFERMLSEEPLGGPRDRLPRRCRDQMLHMILGQGKVRKLPPGYWSARPQDIFQTVMVWWQAFREGRHTFNLPRPPHLMGEPYEQVQNWPPVVPKKADS